MNTHSQTPSLIEASAPLDWAANLPRFANLLTPSTQFACLVFSAFPVSMSHALWKSCGTAATVIPVLLQGTVIAVTLCSRSWSRNPSFPQSCVLTRELYRHCH